MANQSREKREREFAAYIIDLQRTLRDQDAKEHKEHEGGPIWPGQLFHVDGQPYRVRSHPGNVYRPHAEDVEHLVENIETARMDLTDVVTRWSLVDMLDDCEKPFRRYREEGMRNRPPKEWDPSEALERLLVEAVWSD